MADWIVLGCAAGAAALSTYVFFGHYHYQWRKMQRQRCCTGDKSCPMHPNGCPGTDYCGTVSDVRY